MNIWFCWTLGTNCGCPGHPSPVDAGFPHEHHYSIACWNLWPGNGIFPNIDHFTRCLAIFSQKVQLPRIRWRAYLQESLWIATNGSMPGIPQDASAPVAELPYPIGRDRDFCGENDGNQEIFRFWRIYCTLYIYDYDMHIYIYMQCMYIPHIFAQCMGRRCTVEVGALKHLLRSRPGELSDQEWVFLSSGRREIRWNSLSKGQQDQKRKVIHSSYHSRKSMNKYTRYTRDIYIYYTYIYIYYTYIYIHMYK